MKKTVQNPIVMDRGTFNKLLELTLQADTFAMRARDTVQEINDVLLRAKVRWNPSMKRGLK